MSNYTGAAPDTLRAADWRDKAECRTEDPDLFFPKGEGGPSLLTIDAAKAVCRRCPVFELCRQWALETREEYGVWGGLSEADRRAIHRRRGRGTGRGAKPKQEKEPRLPRKPAECGTRAGYHKHYREKTPYCTPCRAANTAAQRRRSATGTSRVAV
jgi:WhiB family redox-sensing transcriptional regulator